MIYEVYLDGKCLYYPDDLECVITNAVLTQELNDSGTFEFDVPVTNPLYGLIQNRISMVQVLKDGKEIFYGEVREADEVIDFEKHVCAIGELSFLFDSIQPQKRYQNYTPLQFFESLLQIHNSQVEEKKQFQLGVVTVTDSNDSIYHYTNYEDTLTAMRGKLCESLEGYLRIRKEDGIRYLDLVRLVDYGKTCTQPIRFGKNLLDYAAASSGTNIATAVLPLGARLDQSNVEGLDAYTTIESVNDGIDYVYSPEAVTQFGWVKVTQNWNDVTTPAILKQKAEEWLTSAQFETLILEVNAIDLSMLNSSIDSFDLGDSVQAIAEPFGMNTWFPVRKKTTYLQDLSSNFIVLSNTMRKSYTQQVSAQVNVLEAEIPQTTPLLEAAKQNASNLIKLAAEGNIFYVFDEGGNPKELLIMDTKDINTAQKVWRWNINGLGYSSTGYNGEYGLAMTMDGHFVADAITVDGLEVGKNVLMGPDAVISWNQVVGGTNMLRNTKAMDANWQGRVIHTYGVEDPFGGYEAHSLQGTSDTDSYWGQETVTVFNEPGKYILSFWAKASRACLLPITGGTTEIKYVELSTEWRKCTVSFDVSEVTRPGFYFGGWYSWYLTDVVIYVYHPMLEDGETATDWTPSPYDGMSAGQVTEITKNTVTTEYVNALGVKASELEAGVGYQLKVNSSEGLAYYILGQRMLGIRPISNSSGEFLGIFFENEHFGASEGQTAVTGQYISTPSMIVGTGASASDDTFGCNLPADFYKDCYVQGDTTVNGNLRCNGTLYTASGTVSVSDRNAKNSVELLDAATASAFIYSLKPSKFKYNSGTSDRFHHGLIAQEVKEAMGNDDWGVYIDDAKGTKGIRYEELIADLIATAQSQNTRLKALEERLGVYNE